MIGNKVAVIGAGCLSLSVAGQFAAAGKSITYIDLEESKTVFNAMSGPKKLTMTGALSGSVLFESVLNDIGSLNSYDLVVVAIMPSMYESVLPSLAAKIKKGATVVFFPGNFGAALFKGYIEKNGLSTSDVTIAESVSYPCVCKQNGGDGILVQSLKSEMGISVEPCEKQEELLSYFNEVFGIYQLADSFLSTSLDNINMSLHPLPVLLNLGAIESKVCAFRHYIDGVSPIIGSLMDKMDAERIAIGRKLSINLTSALDQLKVYYGDYPASNLYEYVSREDGPYPGVGKFGLDSRYIQEDIPYLLVPAIAIADRIGVDVPVMKFSVEIAIQITGQDFNKETFDLKMLESVL